MEHLDYTFCSYISLNGSMELRFCDTTLTTTLMSTARIYVLHCSFTALKPSLTTVDSSNIKFPLTLLVGVLFNTVIYCPQTESNNGWFL